MNDLLIHIGYHKTGTKWIQQELFVSSNNVFEPVVRIKEEDRRLATFIMRGEDGYLVPDFSMNDEEIQGRFKAIIEQKPKTNKVFVISEEGLSGMPFSGGFDSKINAQRIKHNFPNAKILIVVREQKSFLLSVYFEYLYSGGTDSIKRFLNLKYDRQRPFFSPHHINYTLLVKEYFKLFGKENVLVLPYELFRTKPDQFILKISKFVKRQIEIDNSRFSVHWNKTRHYYVYNNFRSLNNYLKKNSLNNYSTSSNRITRKLAANFYLFLIKIIPKSWHGRTRHKIKNYIDNWVKDRYVKTNIELSELINIDLSNYDYH